MEHETFWTLLKDPAHWQFELFLIFLFDVVVGVIIWPYIKKFMKHHKSDDDKLHELEKRISALEIDNFSVVEKIRAAQVVLELLSKKG